MSGGEPGVIYAGNLWKLIQHSKDSESKLKTGWEYLRTIVMEDSWTCNYSDLTELLGREIQAERLRLRKGVFNISYSNHTSIGDFFRILKSYSEPKSSKDFSISLIAEDSLISSQMLELVSFKTLTVLTLYTSCYRNSGLHLHSSIVGLKNLLSQAVNLEKLSLPISRFHDPEDFAPWSIENHKRILDHLKEAFEKLEKLRKLHFGGVFIHPAFFVVPPVGTKVLEYKCYTTPTWWVECSKCSFEGVEELLLDCVDAEKWWQRSDYEIVSGIGWAGDGTFELDGIAFTGLKEFEGFLPPSGPTNFFRLVVENNGGLSASSAEEALRNDHEGGLRRAIENFQKTKVEGQES